MKKLFTFTLALLIAATPAFAHSGRTDGSGGHRDNKNASGLGSYHYHHGYGPHLHPNGICPYTSSNKNPTNTKTPTPTPIPTPTPKPDIPVYVDGTRLSFDQPPIERNDRVLVPLRKIFEVLGATVNYEPTTEKVTATKDNKVVELQIGSNNAYVNGKVNALDVPTIEINGRTLVPVRFVSETFNCSVEWLPYDGNTDFYYVDIKTLTPTPTITHTPTPEPTQSNNDAGGYVLGALGLSGAGYGVYKNRKSKGGK